MPPLSRIFKSLSASHRLSALSLVLLTVSIIPSYVERYQKGQRQQARTAALAKRNAAMAKLSSDLAVTKKEMDQHKKFTPAEWKRFGVLLKQYQDRLNAINAQPLP